MPVAAPIKLDRQVDPAVDHILGSIDAQITFVHYDSYGCAHCVASNEQVAELRDQFGDRLCYVFRHRPTTGNDVARRAAELAECAARVGRFWDVHIALMARGRSLSEQDLRAIRADFAVPAPDAGGNEEALLLAHSHVEADVQSAAASGVKLVPAFFINGRRYIGPWDRSSLTEAMEGSLGHRVRAAALDFASWAPSAGVLLLIAAVVAVILTNSPWGPGFAAFWSQEFGLVFGAADFRLTVLQWVNDGLLSLFFLTVGLEVKREFTVGRLSNRKSAAFPIAAAIGGMVVPALIYRLILPGGPWAHGWGVPLSTDTAFAVALIVMMGSRVPIELRIFLTAAAIVDDIGAIIVVALFYSDDLHIAYLFASLAATILLALLNRWNVYRAAPYAVTAVVLWAFVHASGLHATLAAVILAFFVPTRPPANLRALTAQADAIIRLEAENNNEGLGRRLSTPALNALDAIHDRLESPAGRVLRHIEPWSTYAVLPVFALANSGLVITPGIWGEHGPLMAAIMLGLILGKPVGMVLASALAVRWGVATKPDAYSWWQVLGAGALAGIGFTMSLFIAGEAFPDASDFAAAKIAIFTASLIAAVLGLAIVWKAGNTKEAI